MKHLCSFFAFALFVNLYSCSANVEEKLKPAEFKKILETVGLQLIDIRTPVEFETGYIAGATNINFYDPDFLDKMARISKEKPIAIYCKSDGRTEDAIKLLKDKGFTKIYTLIGGIMAWEKEGYSVIIPKSADEVKKSVTKEEYDEMIKTSHLVIIDFYARWCGPCKMMRPILEKVGAEFEGKGIKIIKLDVDDNKPLANLLLVNEMPLLLFYVDGKLAETMIGFTPEPVLLESVKKYLN